MWTSLELHLKGGKWNPDHHECKCELWMKLSQGWSDKRVSKWNYRNEIESHWGCLNSIEKTLDVQSPQAQNGGLRS